MIINDYEKINISNNTSQLQQWSVHRYVINNIQCNRNLIGYYKLDVHILEPKSHKRILEKLEDDRQVINLDIIDIMKQLKGEYLDVYIEVNSEILYTTKLD